MTTVHIVDEGDASPIWQNGTPADAVQMVYSDSSPDKWWKCEALQADTMLSMEARTYNNDLMYYYVGPDRVFVDDPVTDAHEDRGVIRTESQGEYGLLAMWHTRIPDGDPVSSVRLWVRGEDGGYNKLQAHYYPLDVFLNGGNIDTEDGYIITDGGYIDSEGGYVQSGGGRIDSEGGDIESGGGDVKTEGGDIFTLGGNIETFGEGAPVGGHIDTNGGYIQSGGARIDSESGDIETGGGDFKAEGGDYNGGTTGRITYTQPFAARLTHASDQEADYNDWTTLAFDTETYDEANQHDTSTNNSRLTINTADEAGVYHIGASAYFESGYNGARAIRLVLNGSTVISRFYINNQAQSTSIQVETHTDYKLSYGDYVEVEVYQKNSALDDIDVKSDSDKASPAFYWHKVH